MKTYTVTQHITLLVVLMLTLKGAAGVIGNGVAAVVVAKWTGDLDTEILQKQLAAGPSPLQ